MGQHVFAVGARSGTEPVLLVGRQDAYVEAIDSRTFGH